MVERYGLLAHCHLLNFRRDVAALLSGLDVLVSSSATEAFPLTVAEALACETPTVVTDVGDSAWLVGDAGLVVPSGSPAQLAHAVDELLEMPLERRKQFGKAGRTRIATNFDLSMVAAKYLDVCREAVRARASGRNLRKSNVRTAIQ